MEAIFSSLPVFKFSQERMPCRELRLLRPGVIVVPWSETSAAWCEHIQTLTNVLACWTALLARDTADTNISMSTSSM